MRISAAILVGLVTTKSVEFGSDEEKFMKREIEYCVENRLSNQGWFFNIFLEKKFKFKHVQAVWNCEWMGCTPGRTPVLWRMATKMNTKIISLKNTKFTQRDGELCVTTSNPDQS